MKRVEKLEKSLELLLSRSIKLGRDTLKFKVYSTMIFQADSSYLKISPPSVKNWCWMIAGFSCCTFISILNLINWQSQFKLSEQFNENPYQFQFSHSSWNHSILSLSPPSHSQIIQFSVQITSRRGGWSAHCSLLSEKKSLKLLGVFSFSIPSNLTRRSFKNSPAVCISSWTQPKMNARTVSLLFFVVRAPCRRIFSHQAYNSDRKSAN